MGKPTISDLEEATQRRRRHPIQILPNGEIRAAGTTTSDLGGKKPLTMRENLGGEYGR